MCSEPPKAGISEESADVSARASRIEAACPTGWDGAFVGLHDGFSNVGDDRVFAGTLVVGCLYCRRDGSSALSAPACGARSCARRVCGRVQRRTPWCERDAAGACVVGHFGRLRGAGAAGAGRARDPHRLPRRAERGTRARRRPGLAGAVPLDGSRGPRHRGQRVGARSRRPSACDWLVRRRVGTRYERSRRSVRPIDRA